MIAQGWEDSKFPILWVTEDGRGRQTALLLRAGSSGKNGREVVEDNVWAAIGAKSPRILKAVWSVESEAGHGLTQSEFQLNVPGYFKVPMI